jgi:hypothetical protein
MHERNGDATMMRLDQTLTSMAHQSLAVCRSVSDALAHVFADGRQRAGVTLSLQSRYGTLLKAPERQENSTITLCTHPLLKTLYSEEGEERIALLLDKQEWNMVSCFSISGIAFYPVITVPAPPPELRWARYEMLAALDCFGITCKQALSAFLKGTGSWAPSAEIRHGSYEKSILERLIGYSDKVECAALIDHDGFVLFAEGLPGKADEIAGYLALFNRQAARDLGTLGEVSIRSLSLCDNDHSLCIGQTTGSQVSLALSIKGTESRTIARFLFEAGVASLQMKSNPAGTIGEYIDEMPAIPLRVRDAWLSPPRVTPQGALASVKGSGIFHDPQCGDLAGNNLTGLQWFDARSEAIKAGCIPCAYCNP